MAHLVTDSQYDRWSWPGTGLTGPGTGRHRGRRADEPRGRAGNDFTGHGRHRKEGSWSTELTDPGAR